MGDKDPLAVAVLDNGEVINRHEPLNGNSQTADQVKPVVEKIGAIGIGQPFFDPTAFAAPTGVRFGSSGRNLLRGPGVVNLDLGLFRKFPIRDGMRRPASYGMR